MKFFSLSENKTIYGNYNIPVLLWLTGIVIGVAFLILPWYVFFAIFGFVCLQYIIMRNIEYGYYLILLSIPVERIFIILKYNNVEFSIMPHIFFLTMTFLALIASTGRRENQQGKDSSISIILIAIVIYEVFSLLWTDAFTLGFLLVFSIVFNFLLFYVSTVVLKDEASLKRLTNALVVAGIIVATGVILSQWYDFSEKIRLTKYLTLKMAYGTIASRAAGFGGPAHSAGFLMLPIFIMIGNLFTVDRFSRKSLNILIIGYLIIGLITTASRGGLIGMMGGFFLLFLLHPFTKNKFIKYSFLIILLIPLIILIAKPSYIDRILIGFGYTGELYFSEEKTTQDSSDTGTEGASGMELRKSWWETAFNEMLLNPHKLLLGLGIGSFIDLTGAIGTHSVILSFFFDMGLIGIILCILLVIILYKKISYLFIYGKRTYCYYLLICSVVAFVGDVGIHGLIDYDLTYYPSKMFWFPIGYLAALLNIIKLENRELAGEQT